MGTMGFFFVLFVFYFFNYTSDNQRLILTVVENCLCLLALYEHQFLSFSDPKQPSSQVLEVSGQQMLFPTDALIITITVGTNGPFQ